MQQPTVKGSVSELLAKNPEIYWEVPVVAAALAILLVLLAIMYRSKQWRATALVGALPCALALLVVWPRLYVTLSAVAPDKRFDAESTGEEP